MMAMQATLTAMLALTLACFEDSHGDIVYGAHMVENLCTIYTQKQQERPNPTKRMRTLEDCFRRYSDTECSFHFRFNHDGLQLLCASIGFPRTVIVPQNYGGGTRVAIVLDREELILIMLWRMSYATRLCDLVEPFGLDEPTLSRCFEYAIQFLHARYASGLEDLTRWSPYCAEWANAIYESSNHHVHNVVGFIDGTCRKICRPTGGPEDHGVDVQREFYSGHHRVHCLKFQTVTAPCGLIMHLYGPINGRRHDSFMLRQSRLMEKLERLTQLAGLHCVIFGDPAYPINDFICRMNKGRLTASEQAFNTEMAKHRVTVEWGYRDIIEQFKFVDYEKSLKLFLQPVACYFKVAALLINCQTVMNNGTGSDSNNRTSAHFNCRPPVDLRRYLEILAAAPS